MRRGALENDVVISTLFKRIPTRNEVSYCSGRLAFVGASSLPLTLSAVC